MPSSGRDLFYSLGESVVGYLPNLVGGLVLIAIGWLLGWLVKRLVIQMAAILRLERLLQVFRWGSEFSKADVRYTLFESLGNVAFFMVLLVFLNAAFEAMQLLALSSLMEKGVLFFPRVVVMLLIVAIGWPIAGRVAIGIQKALVKEDVPRASLIARFARLVLLLFFTAMAVAELGVAREIVVIGFATVFATLGILVVVLTAVGGRAVMTRLLDDAERKDPDR